LYAGPKHVDKLKPKPDPIRKARPDLQLGTARDSAVISVAHAVASQKEFKAFNRIKTSLLKQEQAKD